jgi:hypothetical protein
MAIISHQIDVYRVYHYPHGNTKGYTALINCFQANTHRASLFFYRDGVTPQPSIASSGVIYLHFTEARFNEVIATMREEKPIFVSYNELGGSAYLSTSVEPVGEDEGV